MQVQRINYLLEQIKVDSLDPFNYYALALEYIDSEPHKALFYFETLLTNHIDYLPTYYHAANLYFALKMHSQAEDTYKKGISLAERLHKEKPLKELQAAYNMFLDEIE